MMTLERMTRLKNLEELDPSFRYVCKNPDWTDGPRFQPTGDGAWTLEHSGRETTFVMSEAAVKRSLAQWREKCGKVTMTVCSKCASSVMLGVVASIGGSHGLCPSCIQAARNELAKLVTGGK